MGSRKISELRRTPERGGVVDARPLGAMSIAPAPAVLFKGSKGSISSVERTRKI